MSVINELRITIVSKIGELTMACFREPLQMSLLKPLHVNVISRRLIPMMISTAVGDESAHLSKTTRLMQSLYWNKELAGWKFFFLKVS